MQSGQNLHAIACTVSCSTASGPQWPAPLVAPSSTSLTDDGGLLEMAPSPHEVLTGLDWKFH